MLLKNEFYDQNTLKTFAENIDKAWLAYSVDCASPKEKKNAYQFLIYALNIPYLIKHQIQFDFLNQANTEMEIIAACMEAREKRKRKNPDWIPGCTPDFLELNEVTRTLEYYPLTEMKKDQRRHFIEENQLLEVNWWDRLKDKTSTVKFDRYERAPYRVHIYNGRFYQNGKLFTTCGKWLGAAPYKAHSKLKFGAFTLNLDGELSVFNHLWGLDGIKHSSMNSGGLVFCAGEFKIDNGKLIALHTHSGHYRPTLYNLYLLLDYFAERGVDVSATKIYLLDKDIRVMGLDVSTQPIYLNGKKNPPFYEIAASEFMVNFKGRFVVILTQIIKDINQLQTTSRTTQFFEIKDTFKNSGLTKERKACARNVGMAVNCALQFIEEGRAVKTDLIQEMIDYLEQLKEENAEISKKYHKSPKNGRLQHKIESYIKQLKDLCILEQPREENEAIMKCII